MRRGMQCRGKAWLFRRAGHYGLMFSGRGGIMGDKYGVMRMNTEDACVLLETLMDGVNPITGELLPEDHVCQEPKAQIAKMLQRSSWAVECRLERMGLLNVQDRSR